MTTKTESKYKLKKLVEKLSQKKGRHTELISVYVPQGYNLQEIINQLQEEESESQQIKSKQTRKHVLSALSKMIQHLRAYKQTPDNGLAVFCGNVSEKEGQTDIQIWAVEPPEPIEIKLYRCDKEFKLGPLEEILEEKEVYGMLVMDKSEADFALLKGSRIEPIKHLESIVPGKSKAGGQSAARFERVREGLLQDFFKEIGRIAKRSFSGEKLKGILLGGPGPIKEDFHSGKYLPKKLKEKILGIKNTGYTGREGLEELLSRSEDLLKESKVIEEKQLLNKFFTKLREDGKVTYGLDEVLRALNLGSVDLLILSEEIELEKVRYICECGWEKEEFTESEKIKDGCPTCGRDLKVEEEDGVEILEKRVEEMGGSLEIVSKDTEEGKRFYQLGGIGAFLRFKVS